VGAAENRKLLQEIFAEMARGESKLFVESMDNNFSWTVTGHTKWSKTYAGKEVVLRDLLGTLRTMIDGRIKTTAHRFIADEDIVVVEASGSNITKTGKPYNNSYCFVFRLAGGKLQALTEYLDTELLTEAFGA
jgi:uncharacterized protein